MNYEARLEALLRVIGWDSAGESWPGPIGQAPTWRGDLSRGCWPIGAGALSFMSVMVSFCAAACMEFDREDRKELVSARVVSLRGGIYCDPDGLRRRDLGSGRYGRLKREQQERHGSGNNELGKTSLHGHWRCESG